MAYSQTGIVNLALYQVGADTITSIDEVSPNAIKAKAIWDYVLDEVLQARDWRFAKTRYTMAQSSTEPLYAYLYAYPLPSDFLRLVKPRRGLLKGLNPAAYPSGFAYPLIDIGGYVHHVNYDPPVYPYGYPYVIETLPADGTRVLLSDYDNTDADMYINYIRRVTDPTKFTPTFISCLSYKLAEKLTISITEDKEKSREMERKYHMSLYSAAAVNESMDYLDDETGSTSWEDAGR